MRHIRTLWGRMAYSDTETDGMPVVFLHGSGCDSADWQATLQRLPAGLRVVLADFRGHGESSVPAEPFTLEDLADDVLDLMERVCPRPAVLVGHSLGGMVALAAARRSARPAGLLLLEGWTRLGAAAAFGGGRFYGHLDDEAIARIRARAEAARARITQPRWESFWQTVQDFDALDYLRTATIPIIEAYGAMGRLPTTEAGLHVPENPAIVWRWVEEAGHYLPHERPDAVAEMVEEILSRAGGASGLVGEEGGALT